MGVDISEIVWAQGTDAHLSVEEEFSVSRGSECIARVPRLTPTVDDSAREMAKRYLRSAVLFFLKPNQISRLRRP